MIPYAFAIDFSHLSKGIPVTASNRARAAEAFTRVRRSMELYRRAEEIIPGAVQLVSRRPSRLACGVSPVYAARAKGARLWDVDGNEYIDWVSGIGAIILGYADPIVDEAVTRQIETGTIYSINHELELELAEYLIETIPCAEMVRYAKGGGEACAIAVRIARGATGRDKILFCGYHGWHDWYLAANLSADAALDAHLFPGIEPIGVPQALEGTAIPFPYGDLHALGQTLDKHRGEVAAVIMEPFRSEEPPDGYLSGVRKLATEHNVVLIFDEVSTGFRPSASGVQLVVGVTPDMAVFAKSISNGYPMGAVVGRRDVMEPAARMFISSTYWSDTIGLRAALTTLQEVRRRDVPSHVRQIGRALTSRLNELARECQLPVSCVGVDFHPHLRFDVENSLMKTSLATLYIQEMAKRGCHGYPAFYLNAAQGDQEIEQTVEAARETFTLMSEGMQRGTVHDLLACDMRQDAFQRLVR
jgi:glutamate-1-semialdehyde 2,1-aminomutase